MKKTITIRKAKKLQPEDPLVKIYLAKQPS